MKSFKRVAAFLLCVIAAYMLPLQAFAAGIIDLNRDVHLTLSYQNGSTPLAGAKFDIYRIASVDQYGRFIVTDDFTQFNVDIKGSNDEMWGALASALEGFVLRDKITPSDSGRTDSSGLLSFTTDGKHLTPGLYLVLGYRHTQGEYYYDATPFMVMLPSADRETNEWNHDVTANVKYDSSKVPGDSGGSSGSDSVNRKVLKVWEDEGHEDERPQEVIVQLLRGGTVYDTVILNAKNNWRKTWTGLDSKYKWTVVEKELERYMVGLSQEGATFVLTNTYVETEPDKPAPSDPTIPEEPTPPDPDNPGQTDPSSDPGDPFHPKLPQTGQFWWPVPILICVGALCIVIGLLRRKEAMNEK